jgi:putative transposase
MVRINIEKSNKIRNLLKFCSHIKQTIYPNLKFKINYNAKYSINDFLDVLTYVAMTHDFTQNGSKTLRFVKQNTPAGNTVLYHIKKFKASEVQEMFEKSFELIYEMAKKQGIFDKPADIAIDLTEWMYYGDENDPMVVTTKYKNGTKLAYRFDTINVVEAGKRFTLLVLPMSQFTSKTEVLEKLVSYAKQKIKIRMLYVDRGFFSISCIATLEKLGVKYLMPATQNQRIKAIVEQTNAPAVLDYTMGDTRYEHVTFKLVIVKSNKNPEKKVAFATNIDVNEENIQVQCDNYSKRWGIETSYRVKAEFKAKTTSKNYSIRLFYFLFSVCLYNLWILVNIVVNIVVFGKIIEKPLITAKIFGIVLCTTYHASLDVIS